MRVMRRGATVAAVVALSGGLLASAPARAVPAAHSATVQEGAAAAVSKGMTRQCSKGGFTGYIYVNYTIPGSGPQKVNWVQYKITKGRNHGGNKADVMWTDAGTLPRQVYKTARAKQDGQWHRLGGAYTRGSGSYGFSFIFDKSNAGDPKCSKALGTRLP
ncbi:hypothetical protein ACFU53_04875 [Streptomyces sp. NPDC057474]|uniref:hypothetical protein n=1 Tax=Streptomyces sp. NPDC057474 TaxID=3346144 RepID=UPI0036C0C5E9